MFNSLSLNSNDFLPFLSFAFILAIICIFDKFLITFGRSTHVYVVIRFHIVCKNSIILIETVGNEILFIIRDIRIVYLR